MSTLTMYYLLRTDSMEFCEVQIKVRNPYYPINGHSVIPRKDHGRVFLASHWYFIDLRPNFRDLRAYTKLMVTCHLG